MNLAMAVCTVLANYETSTVTINGWIFSIVKIMHSANVTRTAIMYRRGVAGLA